MSDKLKSRIRSQKYRKIKKFKRDFLDKDINKLDYSGADIHKNSADSDESIDEISNVLHDNCNSDLNISDSSDCYESELDYLDIDTEHNAEGFEILSTVNLQDEIEEISELRSWSIECRIPFVHLDKLLNILRRKLLPSLPRSSQTFLHANTAAYDVREMEDCSNTPGQYVYFGVERGLQSCINTQVHSKNSLELQINVDGFKLFKSSTKCMWPILVKIHTLPDIYKPFVVAAYVGNSKPKYVDLFLKDFIKETNKLQNTGIIINNNHFQIKLNCFICDTPARSYLKCTTGHNAQYGCERCLVKRQTVKNVGSYASVNCTKRTDKAFREFLNVEHHTAASPLLHIEPPIDMVNDFLLDSMHLCYLGVMKRLIDFWMSSDLNVKFSNQQKQLLSNRIESIKRQQPEEFKRKIRGIEDHVKFKATEYRFILIYCGPIIFKDILSDEKYKHFLLLHVACRMLSSENAIEYVDYAEKLLIQFISLSEKIYGPQFVVMNVHNLQHLSDDVRNKKCSLSSMSAFPFESYLNEIKNMIRSPHNILAQLSKRLHEINLYLNKKPSLQTLYILRQKGKEIYKLKYKMFTITTKTPNNIFLLHNNNICVIKRIFLENKNILLEINIWNKKNELFNFPCNSKKLHMYELQLQPLNNKRIITLEKIKCKLIKFSINNIATHEKVFVIPLLH